MIKSKNIIILALSMFISTLGTNLVLVAIAIYLFSSQSSILSASGVYIAQFLPVAFFMPIAWKICNREYPKFSLCSMEGFSAIITLLIGIALAYHLYSLVYLLFMCRGFLDTTTKACRNVCLKLMSEGDEVRQANNIIMGSNFLGQAIGSLIGFLLIGKVAMMSIIWIDAITFLISAILCFGLPNIKNQTEPNNHQSLWKEGYRIIKSNHSIFIAMFYLFLTVIFMQSFNQIARNWLPLVWLHLPNRVGALSEVIGCLGIVTGLMIVSVFLTKGKTKQSQLQISFFIAIFSMALPFLSINPIISLAFYFIYMVLFEVSLMVAMNQLLYHCNTQETPSIMVIFYGSAFGGMSIITLIIATATDKWGLPIVTAIMLLLAVLAVFAVGRVEFKTRIEGVRAEASLE